MKLKSVLLTTCLVAPIASGAQPALADTGAEGYLTRGKLMYEAQNYVGAIDQLSHVATLPANASLREEAEFYLALSKFERGDREKSLTALNKFVKDYPTSKHASEALMKIGDYYFYRGDTDAPQTRDDTDDLFHKGPASASGNNWPKIGEGKGHGNNFDEALAAYSKVREGALDADANEDLLYRKAYANLRVGNYEEAKKLYDRLAGTKRYGDATKFYDAYIDYANGNYNSALKKFRSIRSAGELGYQSQYYECQIEYAGKEYDKVISLGKSLLADNANDYFDVELNRLVGESYYHQNNDAQARTYLKKYMSSVDGEPLRTASYAMGVLNYRDGQYRAAVSNMNHVTGLADALAQSAYLYIGQSEMKLNEMDPAAIAFQKAAAMDFDRNVKETAFYNYAVSQSRGGRTPFDKSIDMFEKFLNEYPNSKYRDEVEGYLVNAYLTTNDYNKALTSISHIQNPGKQVLAAKQKVLYNLGVQALSNNKTKTAQNYFKQAIAVGNYDKKILNECKLWLGEAQYRSGDYKEAMNNQLAYVNSTATTDENYGLAQYNLGYSLFQQKRYDAAKKAFQNAINSKTLSKKLLADAYNRIGDTNYYTQDFSAAEKSYGKAIGQNEGAADYSMFQKAMMAGLSKRYSAKVEQIDALLKAYPSTSLAPQALLEKANAQVAMKSVSEALATYAQVVKKYPQSPEARKAMLQEGIVNKNNDNVDAAIEAYKQLIRKYPSSDEAQAAAEDMKLIYAERGQLKQFSDFLESVPNAPRLDVAEVDRLTFEAAEKLAIADKPSITKMQQYLTNYPNGAYAAQAKYYIGRYYYGKGNLNEALTNINASLVGNEDASFAEDALSIKSSILSKQGKNEEAMKVYKELAAKSSSADNKIVAQLGMLRLSKDMKKWKDVKSLADALISGGGLNSNEEKEVTITRAIANAVLGDETSAQADLRRLSKDTQNEYGAQAAYELANIQYKHGELKLAEKTLNSFIEQGTPHAYWLAKGFILLSDVYHKQGKDFEAREYLQSLKENYPGKDKEIFDEINTRLNSWKQGKASSSSKSEKSSKKTSSRKNGNSSSDNKSK